MPEIQFARKCSKSFGGKTTSRPLAELFADNVEMIDDLMMDPTMAADSTRYPIAQGEKININIPQGRQSVTRMIRLVSANRTTSAPTFTRTSDVRAFVRQGVAGDSNTRGTATALTNTTFASGLCPTSSRRFTATASANC